MKYECSDCKKQFIHPATKQVSKGGEDSVEVTETRVCPHCMSLNFDEIPAETQQTKNVLKVARESTVEGVNARLAEGYTIIQEWAKETLLYLYQKDEPEEATE